MIKVFILGSRCNMSCKFCMSEEGDLKPDVVFEEMAKMDGGMVVFAGGEPLLYGELEGYLEFAKRRGLKTKVQTNGVLLDSIDYLDLIDVLNLPLDGTKEIHDRMREKGHFNVVIRAFELDKEFTITTVLTKVNVGNIEGLARLINELSESVRILNWKIFKFKPKGRGKIYRNLFEITDEEYSNAVRTAKDISNVKVYAIKDPDEMKTTVLRSSKGRTSNESP